MQKYQEPLLITTTKLTQSQIEELDRLQIVTGKTRSELLREAVSYLLQVYKTDLQDKTQTA